VIAIKTQSVFKKKFEHTSGGEADAAIERLDSVKNEENRPA
jgi:hypothetical protein